MMTLLFGLIYTSLAVSLVACIIRAVRYARLPLNLRWELYPVPHEDPARAAHGGSYFEDLDWWTKPQRKNRLGDLQVMGAEILFFRALYEHNRKLWRWSYPFHVGLYLVICTAAAAIVRIPAPILRFTGMAGCALVMIGAAGLLLRRVKTAELRVYSAPADYFNLCFFIVTAGLLAGSTLTPGAPGLSIVAKALVTFDTSITLTAVQAAALAMSALLVAYIPMTHMAHFIGKYFTYHSVRWGDELGTDPRLARRIAGYLTYHPTWSAAHIAADGAGSWAEIVTRNPTTEKSK
jgi:nitrate reductase gamma subunit